MMREIHLDSVDSTNTYCKENHQLLDDFSFVVADHQTAGRGRLGRLWIDDRGKNLLFSYLIKDATVLSYGPMLSLLAAVAVASTLQDLGLPQVSIKWPNDVYVRGKKVAGILLEGQLPEYAIVGVGINVNQRIFGKDLRHEPTSLCFELGKEVSLASLQGVLFPEIVSLNRSKTALPNALSFFSSHDYLRGKKVRLPSGEEGVAHGVNPWFELLVDVQGKIIPVASGEVLEILN